MWSIPCGFAPCELFPGLRDVKPERSTCKLVRSSRTSASDFSWWWGRCNWSWTLISVIECSAASGAASTFLCSRSRKPWLANSNTLDTGGGGVTDTSDLSLDASLCCVIAAGDAVLAAVTTRSGRVSNKHTTEDKNETPQWLRSRWYAHITVTRAIRWFRMNEQEWAVSSSSASDSDRMRWSGRWAAARWGCLWTPLHVKYVPLLKLIRLASMTGCIECCAAPAPLYF